MMYSEFVTNTGCFDTPYNHAIFEKLNILYMADDTMDKATIYEWGKKLVVNELTEEEKKAIRKLQTELADVKSALKTAKERLKYYKEASAGVCYDTWKNYYEYEIKSAKNLIQYYTKEVAQCKLLLGEHLHTKV